jgi:hypothetical protein
MATVHHPPGHAATLAETIDTALAGQWDDSPPALAVLSWRGPGHDDLELAVKRTDADPTEELSVFAGDHLCPCLAVCLSRLEERTVRVTVASDGDDDITIVRHRDGRTERQEVSDGPTATAELLLEAMGEMGFPA